MPTIYNTKKTEFSAHICKTIRTNFKFLNLKYLTNALIFNFEKWKCFNSVKLSTSKYSQINENRNGRHFQHLQKSNYGVVSREKITFFEISEFFINSCTSFL